MVFVSQESNEQTNQRLQSVLRVAELKIFEEPYAYIEKTDTTGQIKIDPKAIAFIRDEDSVCQLLPIIDPGLHESFFIICFHFPEKLDNSGFVGWLASRFKQQLGTGVFVICGQNSSRGGVYDYFGIPEALRSDALLLLETWRTA